MLFRRLTVKGLLSFGPKGIDLPLEPLNVLIGPNGSGKTNLLEALAVLQAAPGNLSEPFVTDGIVEWLWKGPNARDSCTIEVSIRDSSRSMKHSLTLTHHAGHPVIKDERLESRTMPDQDDDSLRFRRSREDGWPTEAAGRFIVDMRESESKPRNLILFDAAYHPEMSFVSLVSPPDFPELWRLKEQYTRISLFRDWSFGPKAGSRQSPSAHDRADFLSEGGANLPVVLSHFHGESKARMVKALRQLSGDIMDFSCSVAGGRVLLFLTERGSRLIPATRLSDGTLRYLCLLAILLHPEPPPLVAIEEPELGLHPDLLPTLADLLVDASQRTQLVVTTHSDILVDALTEKPESIVVCEKHDGQTEMRRLDRNDLEKWLKDYRLGELWTSGELGGNRW